MQLHQLYTYPSLTKHPTNGIVFTNSYKALSIPLKVQGHEATHPAVHRMTRKKMIKKSFVLALQMTSRECYLCIL